MRRLPIPVCRFALLALLTISALSAWTACAPPDPESPIELTAADLETQIAFIRRSATVAAERLQITVVGARARLEQVRQNSTALGGTLTARGFDPAALSSPTAVAMSARQVTAAPARSSATPLIITPPASQTTTEANATDAEPRLSDFRVGLEVGADDCVAVPRRSLPANASAIYTSARAQNLSAGSELQTRWFAAGAERTRLTYAPTFAIEDNCVWFFITPDETPFVPGGWEVLWELAGQPYPRQPFDIAPN